jgi:hypothetical protein
MLCLQEFFLPLLCNLNYLFLPNTSSLCFSLRKRLHCITIQTNLRCSELSSGMYCRVKWLSTDVSEVRTASIIRDESHFTRQYIPEDNSEHHTLRRENLKSHKTNLQFALLWCNVLETTRDNNSFWTVFDQAISEFILLNSSWIPFWIYKAREFKQKVKYAGLVIILI